MSCYLIQGKAAERGITRLCHITRSMALPFILGMGEIVATSRLDADETAIYYPNDVLRLDGHKTHVSCSIQYPNAWYLRMLQARELLFEDWIVLLAKPDPIWNDGTLFCPVNAATRRGRLIAEGERGFDSLFDEVAPSELRRGLWHLPSCPTDNQAEVLVSHGIPLTLVQCVVVPGESQAQRENARMKAFGLDVSGLELAVCPEFFDPRLLAGRIASGVATEPQRTRFWKAR